MNAKELPQAIEMEKQLLSTLFKEEGHVVLDITSIIDASDLYRVEHRLIFQAIMRLYAKDEPINYLVRALNLYALTKQKPPSYASTTYRLFRPRRK